MRARRTRLHRRLARAMAECIADFSLIAEGDRILCAVSGGKDSYALWALLADQQRRAPVRFELLAINVDQGHPDYRGELVTGFGDARGLPLHTATEDTYSIVKAKLSPGQTPCVLCSRLRRGILYRTARELGYNKIALGHHRDDLLATLLLNLVFSGQLKSMPPKLVNDDGDLEVIRPLAYCAEADLAAFATEQAFPVQPCGFCSETGSAQRSAASELLGELDQRYPGCRAHMLRALRNVRSSHLLDVGLWRKLGLAAAREGDGDEAPASADGWLEVDGASDGPDTDAP